MKKIIIFLYFLKTLNCYGQVKVNTISPYSNPSYLIDNVLIGSGIITSNHNYTGHPGQIGYFTDSLAMIGMDSGFILSTGIVDSIGSLGADTMPWWNYIYDSLWNIIDSTPVIETHHLSSSLNAIGDPDLLTIANSVPGLIGQSFSVTSTGDAAILEFDFTPSSDTVRFKYAFASEEYLDFINSNYNDVFAFLISGPGISGPYTSPIGFPNGAINIANIPNLSPPLPITVSTINNTLNYQYYNYDTLANVSAFNGFTNVFTAEAVVIPCETYHIKLAIADGSDDSYDSAVFFESGSFNSIEPGPPIATVITNDVLCFGDSTGSAHVCVQGGVGPYTLDWNGYNPNSLTAGNYLITVTDAIGNSSSTNYTINQPNNIISNITQTSIDLNSNTTGGTPNYTYQWIFSNTIVGTNATYTPIQNGDYMVVVTDENGCTDTSLIFTVNNIGTSLSNHKTKDIIISPNPFSEFTYIQLINKNDIIKNISMYNYTGKEIKINRSINNGIIKILRENMEKGIYIIQIETNSYLLKRRLIII